VSTLTFGHRKDLPLVARTRAHSPGQTHAIQPRLGSQVRPGGVSVRAQRGRLGRRDLWAASPPSVYREVQRAERVARQLACKTFDQMAGEL